MKKGLIFILCLMLAMGGSSALAYELLPGVAVIGEEDIYYSGSVDGVARGIFKMGPSGEDARAIYPKDMAILAASDEYLLTLDYDGQADTQLMLLDKAGAVVYQAPHSYVGCAIEEDGAFYLGASMLTIKDGKVEEKQLFDVAPQEGWRIEPVRVDDGFLYYLDLTACPENMVENDWTMATLKRMNLVSGDMQGITPEGTTVIGFENDQVFYELNPFWVMDGESSKQVTVESGLYRANVDGTGTTKLLAFDMAPEQGSQHYQLMDDGVLYGLETRYVAGQEDFSCALKRMTTKGEALKDIAVPNGTLGAVNDGKVYLATCNIITTEDDYVQKDQIYKLDTATGDIQPLGEDVPRAIFFTEASPVLVMEEAKLYFVAFDQERTSSELHMLNVNNGTDTRLALGFGWTSEADAQGPAADAEPGAAVG
ncbi:MAG: hypothetical protein RSE59_03910 [Clostridia bacterium]